MSDLTDCLCRAPTYFHMMQVSKSRKAGKMGIDYLTVNYLTIGRSAVKDGLSRWTCNYLSVYRDPHCTCKTCNRCQNILFFSIKYTREYSPWAHGRSGSTLNSQVITISRSPAPGFLKSVHRFRGNNCLSRVQGNSDHGMGESSRQRLSHCEPWVANRQLRLR